MKYYTLKLTEAEYKALRYIIAKGWSTQFDANYLKVFEKIYNAKYINPDYMPEAEAFFEKYNKTGEIKGWEKLMKNKSKRGKK